MMSGIRVLSLFLGYSLIGFGGDYAVGLLAQDIEAGQSYQYDYDVAVDRAEHPGTTAGVLTALRPPFRFD